MKASAGLADLVSFQANTLQCSILFASALGNT
jgi:hypothetical protein